MSEWFQAQVEFLRQQDNGLIKKIKETYLVDSMSFTECEARVLKEQGEGVREIKCKSIARSPIAEVVFYGDTDQWHKVKVCYSLMDEDTEKEKKITTYFLVNAADVKEAYERTEEHLKDMLVPFTIPKVEESPICEVFQYEKQAPKGFVKVDADGSKIGKIRDQFRKDMQKIADNGGLEISVSSNGSDFTTIAKPKEAEIECAMDGDSVEVEYSMPPSEYVTNPKSGLIDPTDGQVVAFDVDQTRISITNKTPEGMRRYAMFDALMDCGFIATESIIDDIIGMREHSDSFVEFANNLNEMTDGKSTTTIAEKILNLLND